MAPNPQTLSHDASNHFIDPCWETRPAHPFRVTPFTGGATLLNRRTEGGLWAGTSLVSTDSKGEWEGYNEKKQK